MRRRRISTDPWEVAVNDHVAWCRPGRAASWEALADEMQATRPVTGVCYFDRRQVPADRLDHLAVMHPVLSPSLGRPSFQLFVDGDAVRVAGSLDCFCTDQLRRILASAPRLTELVLDLSETEFTDHRSLLTLDQVARQGHRIRVRGAKPVVRRIWSLLDVATPALELC